MIAVPRKSSAGLASGLFTAFVILPFLAHLPLADAASPRSAGSAATSSRDEFKIIPGAALGLARLGMTQSEAHMAMGNVDKTSKLAGGRIIETAEWKEPKGTTFISYLYDRSGKIIQIETNAPVPATAGGISIKSSISQVKAAYPAAREVRQNGRSYLLDTMHGIAFGLQTDKTAKHELFALVILQPGQKLQD